MARDEASDRQTPDIARDADARIGAYVAELRTGKDMTQGELASQMRAQGWKWSQQSCWAIEKGRQTLRLQEALDLAHILGVDGWTFLKYAEDEDHGVRDDIRELNQLAEALMRNAYAYERTRRKICLEIDRPHRPLEPTWRHYIAGKADQTALDFARAGIARVKDDYGDKRPATATGPIADIYFESWERLSR